MKKLLKIRFVKFEKALAMQILQQVGKFKDGKRVKIGYTPVLAEDCLCLRGIESEQDNSLCCIDFSTNDERDKYLEKVVRWISAEQFATGRKLKIGEACLFSDDGKDWHSGEYAGKCARQLGKLRFLALDGDVSLTRWKYVKPLYGALKVDGDVYTWEMEVEDEK